MERESSMGALLDAPVPDVSEAEVAALVAAQYGLHGAAARLSGERDANFVLRADGGAAYAVRVINPEEAAGVSAFQSGALLHLARTAPDVPVPRLHAPLHVPLHGPRPGGTEAVWTMRDGRVCRVRVLDYLPGRPLLPGGAQRAAVGACLARLDAGLQGFRHGSEGHRLLWDMQHAAGLRGLVAHVPDAADRAVAEAVLDRFETHALPVLGGLRHQVIHNDFNPHNILADAGTGALAGIIDFGDMVRAPLVQDLATAAAYQITPEEAPLTGPAALAAAYHAVLPLEPAEVAILADLVATRLVMTVLISGLRARRQPGNAAYILRNFGRSIAALRRFAAVPRAEAHAILLEGLFA